MHRAVIIVLAALGAVQWAGAAVPAFVTAGVDSGGPDPYGYTWKNSSDPGGPVYAWIDILPYGTTVTGLADDNYVGPFPIGFTFDFYGNDVTQYWIGSNGYLEFGPPFNAASPFPNTIPLASPPNNFLAVYMADWDLTYEASVKRWNNADSLVVSWVHVPAWQYAGMHDFQVILDRLTGNITFQYGEDQAGQVSNNDILIGIENASGNMGLMYMHDWYPAANTAVTFYYPSQIPDVTVSLVPLVQPIQIPASGGNFEFFAFLTNNATAPQPLQVWTRQILPGGGLSGVLMGPYNVTLAPGTSGWLRHQNVPGSTPPGEYIYIGYAGTYPSAVFASDSLPYTKLTTGDGPIVDNWENWGETPGDVSATTPTAFQLKGACPNPFNPTAAISYQLATVSQVSLRVYDISGKLVTTLVEGRQEAGAHSAVFDGSNLATGIYLYALSAGSWQACGKMALVK